jgi:23S rRNA U2552 (ribose-2'-O)-methylase RlmE/FtsJ
MMHEIGHEMDTLTGAFDLPGSTPTILDLCMAPGGFAKYVLRRYSSAKVDALSLPEVQGGHKVRIPYGDQDQRVSVTFTDLTKLTEGSGRPDLLKSPNNDTNLTKLWPYNIKRYDLILCDGQVPRQTPVWGDDEQFSPVCLTFAQLYLSLKRVKTGGTIIVLLHRSSIISIFRLIRKFSQFSDIQIFKPHKNYTIKSSFYLVAKNIDPDSAKCLEAMDLFKLIWEKARSRDNSVEATILYKELSLTETSLQPELKDFGPQFIELVRPIWKIQADALEKAPFVKGTPEVAPRPICEHYLRGRCRFGNSCFKSHDATEQVYSEAKGPQSFGCGDRNHR